MLMVVHQSYKQIALTVVNNQVSANFSFIFNR